MGAILSLRGGEREAQKSFWEAADKMNLMSKQPALVAHSLSVSGELLGWAQKSHPPRPGPATRTVFDSQPYLDF